MASKAVSEVEFNKLLSRISELELTVQALNTNYFNRNWSSNFNLLQPKDLGFSLVVGQSLQPFVGVGSIPFNKNTTTTILSTVGGPNGGVLLGFEITVSITDAATVGPNCNLILTVDNVVSTIAIFATGANQTLPALLTNMAARISGSPPTFALVIFTTPFQSSLVVQIAFDGAGNSIAANLLNCEVMWSKSTF